MTKSWVWIQTIPKFYIAHCVITILDLSLWGSPWNTAIIWGGPLSVKYFINVVYTYMKACYVLLECHLNEILKIFPLRFLKFDRVSLQIWSDIWKVKSASFLNQYQASQLKVNLVKVEVWQPFNVFNHFNLQDIFKTICYWRELCSSWKRENVGNNVIQ